MKLFSLVDGKLLENRTTQFIFECIYSIPSTTVHCIFHVIRKYLCNETRAKNIAGLPLAIRKNNSLKKAPVSESLLYR